MSRNVDWRRLEDNSANELLSRAYPSLRPQKIEVLGNRGGFSGAAIWRVVTSAGHFALRRWPQSGLPRERIIGLHRLLEHVRREGLQCVAVPIPATDGTTVIEQTDHFWQLEPWLPGTSDFHARPSHERLYASMTALAQWHRAAERFVPHHAATEWFLSRVNSTSPAVSERLALLGQIEASRRTILERAMRDDTTVSRSTAIRELAHQIWH
jgi:Phosphotransferase enzyme family